MNENYKTEIINFIKENKMEDVFTIDNIFLQLYGCNLYIYLRVSTEKQDFGRQLIEIHEWAKKKKIQIYIGNIFFDKYTGKKLNRVGYVSLKNIIKVNDYLVTTNLNRLGRNWDDIKKEWYSLECNNINRIIIDNDNLSVELPNEMQKEMSLNRKMIQDITFSACLYSACQKIEEVRKSTKDGLKTAIKNGKKVGVPRSNLSSQENFIHTLEYMIDNSVGQSKATLKTRYPKNTFQRDLKKCYIKYKTKDYQEILSKIKEENQCPF